MVADIWEMAKEMNRAIEEIDTLRKLTMTQADVIDELRAELKDIGRTTSGINDQLEGEARENEKLSKELKRKSENLVKEIKRNEKLQTQNNDLIGQLKVAQTISSGLKEENRLLKKVEDTTAMSPTTIEIERLRLENARLKEEVSDRKEQVQQLMDFRYENEQLDDCMSALKEVAQLTDPETTQRVVDVRRNLQFLKASFADKDVLPEQFENLTKLMNDVEGKYPS